MKQTQLISMIVIFFIVGYMGYSKYKKDIDIAYYLGGVDERATLFSLMTLKRTNKTFDFDKYIKSTISFDLSVLNKYQDIKSKINLKKYCETIMYIKNDLNASVIKKMNRLCGEIKGI